MTDDDHDLLYYIDRLRRPYKDLVIQTRVYRTDKGRHEIACVTHVERDGLLQQLREAVYSDIGRHGASGSGADRLPFNQVALALYERIEHQIGNDYVNLTGKPVELELERTLTLWYLEHSNQVRAGKITAADDEVARLQAKSWFDQIEGMFNPPRRLELTVERTWKEEEPVIVKSRSGGPDRTVMREVDRSVRLPAPCPQCEARYAYDPANGDRMLALLLEYYELGAETFGKLRAVCRACEYEWHGDGAARELMVAIDEMDRELQTREQVEQLRGLILPDTPSAREYVHEDTPTG